MNVLLAAYDPSTHAANGYWSWHHPDLPRKVLEDFYYEIDPSERPDASIRLTSDVVHGGCTSVGNDWRCVYRFLDGGFDRSNRPVWVLICGFVRGRELQHSDWLGLLESSVFPKLSQRFGGDGGLPRPMSLEETWTRAEVRADPKDIDRVLRVRRVDESQLQRIRSLAAIAGELPQGESFRCTIRLSPTETSAQLLLATPTPPGDPPPKPSSVPPTKSSDRSSEGCSVGRVNPLPERRGAPEALRWLVRPLRYVYKPVLLVLSFLISALALIAVNHQHRSLRAELDALRDEQLQLREAIRPDGAFLAPALLELQELRQHTKALEQKCKRLMHDLEAIKTRQH